MVTSELQYFVDIIIGYLLGCLIFPSIPLSFSFRLLLCLVSVPLCVSSFRLASYYYYSHIFPRNMGPALQLRYFTSW